jgi:fibro-slime domain-containing protein
MRTLLPVACLSLVLSGWFYGCGEGPSATPRTGSGANGSGADGTGAGATIDPTGGMGGMDADGGERFLSCTDDSLTPPGCGDGVLTQDEACDDGNHASGDGCTSNCLCVEPGYSCSQPGKPCRQIAKCGDGFAAFPEPCDDGNLDDGDGCSSRCKIELGYKCDGSPSVCTPTVCGDGKREGSEGCDDGNTLPFDGCSSVCQTEPNCAGESCTSECGDGIVIAEECDDGNTIDGDGCSSDCKIEPGFVCSQDLSCEKINDACVLRVPAIFRDFSESHTDFEVTCKTGVKGIVQPSLNAQGKPVLAKSAGACIASADSFAQWYTDSSVSATIVGDIVLFDNGKGGFVNRWGANGEQWAGKTEYSNLRWCGHGGGNCAGCTLAADEKCYDPCTPWNQSAECAGKETTIFYDGNPVFFPLDGHPDALSDTRTDAIIAPEYGYNWVWEKDIIAGAGLHNFHFTTEVHYWFTYDASTSATLDFTGDDDVWVFLNGKLAVDLGGLHPPENGSVTVNATTAPTYGLVSGNVYRISVFHAERKREGSSFRLTLDGFKTSRSECGAICGDGIVSLGEECDDGVNDGGYGECHPGCVLGARCGDGTVQEGEDCDDGNNFDGDGCGSACRALIVR